MAAKNVNFRAGARERETFDQAPKMAGCRQSGCPPGAERWRWLPPTRLEVGLVFHVDLLGARPLPSHPSDMAKSAVAQLVTGVNGFKLRAAEVDPRGTSVASFDVSVIEVL